MSVKLSDLDKKKAGSFGTGQELIEADLNGARLTHSREIDKRKKEVQSKIDSLEKKLQSHFIKEGMMDKIISQTYMELEGLKDNEFTRRGQKQTVLIKQLEALSIIHDTILKYEDMIQKYHKIQIDLDNNKLNSFLKVEGLKKEEEKVDEGLSELLQSLQEQFKSSTPNSLMSEIEKELQDDNY